MATSSVVLTTSSCDGDDSGWLSITIITIKIITIQMEGYHDDDDNYQNKDENIFNISSAF